MYCDFGVRSGSPIVENEVKPGNEKASTQIRFPDKPDSKKPEEWKWWIEPFECYRISAGLDAKEAKVQINTLVYAMGGNANEIFKSFELTEEDQVYETIKQLLEIHFVGRKNAIFDLTNQFKAQRNPWSILLKACLHSQRHASLEP